MPQITTTPGRVIVHTCAAELHAVRAIAKSIRTHLEKLGLPAEHVDQWELIVTEGGNNAVRYLRGAVAGALPIEFSVEVTPGRVELRIRDHTPGFDLPERIELPHPLAEGGRGLFLMSSLSDSMEYLRGRTSNYLIVRKSRPDLTSPAVFATPVAGSVESAVLESTLQAMTEDLAASYESLSAIFRFTEDLARGDVDASFVERWLHELKSITGADWFVLRLFDGETRCLRPFQTLPPRLALTPLSLPAESGETVTATASVEMAAASGRLDVWFDHHRPPPPDDPLRRLGPDLSGFAHPMYVSGELMGVLTIGFHDASQAFTAGQVNIVQTLADLLAIQIRDSRHEQARLQACLMERDFKLAAEIQRRLLPKEFPSFKRWVTRGFCQSARRVGGDFYDILPVGPGCLLLAIADVMGKGLPAALFATIFRTLIRARRDLAPHPGAFLEWLNADLTTDLAELEMFITAQLAHVDLRTREMRIAGAGHPPLLLAGLGVPARQVLSAGPPLGIREARGFPETRLLLPDRARVLMYTDGVSEAPDDSGTPLGIDPLLEILTASVTEDTDVDALTDRFNQLQHRVAGSRVAADDRTVLLLFENAL